MGDIVTIMQSCKNAESAQVPTMLHEISRSIQKGGSSAEFCSVSAKEGVQWLQDNNSEAYDLLQKFLKKHAHRAYFEVKLHLNPTRNGS